MSGRLKKALILMAKLGVAAALLWWAFSDVDWPQLGRHVADANRVLLAVSFVGFLIPVFAMALRWWCLLRAQEIYIGYWEAVRLTFLGQFFGFIMPGMVSGDLFKAYYACKHTDRKAAAVVSVFLDRASGLAAFAIVPAVVMTVLVATGMPPAELVVPAAIVAFVLGVLVIGSTLLLSRSLRKALLLDRVIARLPLQKYVSVTGEAVRLYRRRWPVVAAALGITFVGQTVFVTAIMIAGAALAPEVPWYRYYIYVPLIYIIAAVPISPGGVGVVEACFIKFFVVAPATVSEVAAVALAARVMPMVCSLPGLLVAVTGPKLPKAEEMEAEIEATDPRAPDR